MSFQPANVELVDGVLAKFHWVKFKLLDRCVERTLAFNFGAVV